MAVDLPEMHAAALDHTRRTVAGIVDEQWHLDTPCAEWDVQALLQHVVSGNLWVPELTSGRTIEEVGDALDGDVLGNDPLAAYDASAAGAAAAFRTDGVMDAPVGVSYGPVPGSVYCGHRFIDVLVHGWDLAYATRQDGNLPEDLIDACWAVVEPQRDDLAGSGAFATVAIPDDGDLQTKLLAVLGRSE